jgi:hypothetical protein
MFKTIEYISKKLRRLFHLRNALKFHVIKRSLHFRQNLMFAFLISQIISDCGSVSLQTLNSSETSYSFEFTAGQYFVELWGAEGGTSEYAASSGKGGYISGQFNTESTRTVYFYLGSRNGTNGGGSGGTGANPGANGGGATDMRLGSTSTSSRVLVAGGGGGGGAASNGFTKNSRTAAGGGGGGSSGDVGGSKGNEGGFGGGFATAISGGVGGAGGSGSTSSDSSGLFYPAGGGGGGAVTSVVAVVAVALSPELRQIQKEIRARQEHWVLVAKGQMRLFLILSPPLIRSLVVAAAVVSVSLIPLISQMFRSFQGQL